MMHGGEKSGLAIVATKLPNKAGQPVAEAVERRAGTEGNAGQQSTLRPQIRAGVPQALDRVRQAARHRRKERFTALLHHRSVETLEMAFYALKRRAAPGVDGVTWQEYEADLGRRLADLHGRIHRGAYRPQPSRRAWIPKADGRQRPLAIAALEDKMASRAGESHPHALPEPYVTLSRHTAPDVRPFPCRKRQCANRCGLARITRANHSLAPLGRRRNRLNLLQAQRIRKASMRCKVQVSADL